MTTVRLAWGGPPAALKLGLKPQDDEARHPALLVSWYYWKQFIKHRQDYGFRDYSLDSGAFSAMNSGKAISLDEYIEAAGHLLATDPQCTEVFALDVIGDWKQSLKNTERMWKAGVPAIPAFHVGSPWEALEHLVANYPKVALGGLIPLATRRKRLAAALDRCFSIAWRVADGPYPMHGFACVNERSVMSYPFDSVDASSWERGPYAFGQWKTFGKMSVRGGRHTLRPEVEWYMNLERRASHRWRNVLKQARERQCK